MCMGFPLGKTTFPKHKRMERIRNQPFSLRLIHGFLDFGFMVHGNTEPAAPKHHKHA